MSQTRNACPDAEQLGAFVEGSLRGDERDAVMRHLAECRECLDLVEAAPDLDAEISRPPAPSVGPTSMAPSHGADALPGATPPRPARVVPFERRRRARPMAVALPLAAAAALAVAVLLRVPPPAASPRTAARPSSAPSVASATPRPAVDLVDLAKLPAGVFPALRLELGFGGPPRGRRGCLLLGVETVAVEVEARRAPAEAQERLRRLQALLQVDKATPLRALRDASGCDAHAEAYAGAYAVALVQLAAHTRDAALLAHPEIEAGLKQASSAGLEGLPQVLLRRAAVGGGATSGAWESLREASDALVGQWR